MIPIKVDLLKRPGREPKFKWIELADGRRFRVRSTGAWVPCPGRAVGSIARIWSVEIEWKGAAVHRFIVEDGGAYFIVKPDREA